MMSRVAARGEGIYNVVVLGAGPAGLVVAVAASSLGARVALVEKARMGGDCLNTGCVPSKALLASARLAERMRHADRWGLPASDAPVDFARVIARVRARRAHIEANDSQARMESLGIDVFRAPARFASPREVDAGGTRLRARHVVIATGSRPSLPPVDGLAACDPFTTDTIFDGLDTRPDRLLVLGGGAVGCELGQAFAALGVAVTLVEAAPRLLAREEPEAAAVVHRRLEEAGARVLTGVKAVRAEKQGAVTRLHLDGPAAPLEAEAVLVAAGRVPNVDDLGLEQAGVAFTKKGVAVDASLRTNVRGVWAAGDVTGGPQFTHVADHHARVLVRNLVFPLLPARVDLGVIPTAVYTSPEVARVGLTEEEARQKGLQVEVLHKELADVDRAILEDETQGFAKMLIAFGRVVGATLVAEHAGELIHEIALLMKQGGKPGGLSALVHAYPTVAEVARKVADDHARKGLTPGRKRLLAWLFEKRRG